MSNGTGDSSLPQVLVVDDDMANRIMVRAALEQAGFGVNEAENGLVALDVFKKVRPDIVLLDVMMPELDGFGACSQIREMPEGEHTPILMMTALEDVEAIVRAYDVGATDFATKPINYTILTQRLRYMFRAKQTEARLANAQRIAKIGHWEWEVESDAFTVSNEVRKILHLPQGQGKLTSGDVLQAVHRDDRETVKDALMDAVANGQGYSVEHRVASPDGPDRVVHQEAEVNLDPDGKTMRVIGTAQDITERRRAEQQIRYLAYYDNVTGLPNRALLREHLRHALDTAQRHERVMAILFMDLDHFKRINDTLGHDAGDQLLKDVSERLNECLRQSDRVARMEPEELPTGAFAGGDTVARLGGDEFVMLLADIRRPEDAASVARRIGESLAESFTLGGEDVYVTTSIGISTYPLDGTDVDTLMKCADAAMYDSKKRGRNSYQFYSESINADAAQRLSLETDLRNALNQRSQLTLHYQPKVDLRTNRIVGVEALCRWRHPDKGMVPPLDFIPLAEDSGLIVPLGDWVLRTACEQSKFWQSAGLPPILVSVNLSARQFREERLKNSVIQALEDTGLAPEFLELELTESLLMDDTDATGKVLTELKELGLHISIDDFGTGYSSLSYLNRLPVDVLKIDYSFVKDIVESVDNQNITKAIISMAHSLSLKVIAEGVETREQLELLRELGCDEVQGYYISRPIEVNDFIELLKRNPDFS